MYKSYFEAVEECNIEEYFKSFHSTVLTSNPVDILKSIFTKDYRDNFILFFLIYNPETWTKLNLRDWTKIIESISREPITYPKENSGCYMDMLFLNKFISVNALDIFFFSPSISLAYKQNMLRAMQLMNYFIVSIDDDEKRNYFEDNGLSYDIYHEVHQKLMREGMKDGFKDVYEVNSYLDEIQISLS